jgi:hypothetical protein
VDDDAPRSLQPYLQRVAHISLSGGGGIAALSETRTAGASTTWSANTWCRISGYPTESLFLGAQAELSYFVFKQRGLAIDPESSDVGTSMTHSISPAGAGTIGYRNGDTLLTLSIYHATTRYQGQWSGSGSMTLGARTVISDALDLSASLYLQIENVIPSLSATYYLTQNVGVIAGLGWQHYTVPPVESDYVRGSAGISYWISPTLGLSAIYGVAGDHENDGTRGWVQTLNLSIWTRS